MKKLILLISLAISSMNVNSSTGKSFVDRILDGRPYISIGTGYKFIETTEMKHFRKYSKSDLIKHRFTARIEIGGEWNNFRAGISHHSQWLTGYPFNDLSEYHKTEVFIDYIWRPFE